MTKQEWNTWTSPVALLKCLVSFISKRKYRLFACGCLRRAWPHLRYATSRRVVETAERFADGEASKADLDLAIECVRKTEDATVALGYRDDPDLRWTAECVAQVCTAARALALR